MYDLENMRTFEAINRTVSDVIRPTGSKMMGKVSSELLIVVISQCRSTVFWLNTKIVVIGTIIVVKAHIIMTNDFDELLLSNMD
jgi:hypothetical protein